MTHIIWTKQNNQCHNSKKKVICNIRYKWHCNQERGWQEYTHKMVLYVSSMMWNSMSIEQLIENEFSITMNGSSLQHFDL